MPPMMPAVLTALMAGHGNKRAQKRGPGRTPGPHVISLGTAGPARHCGASFIFCNGALLEAPFGVRWTVFHRHLRPLARHVHGRYGCFTPRYATNDTLALATARYGYERRRRSRAA